MTKNLRATFTIAVLFVVLALPHEVGAAGRPANIFDPVLPKLRVARIPVYVPSWLPRFQHRVYPLVDLGAGGRTYELDLSFVRNSAGTAALAFYLTANLDVLSPGPNPKRVALGGGVTGYIGSVPGTATDSLTVRWRRNGVVYAIGRLGSPADLIRCARSVVRVGR